MGNSLDVVTTDTDPYGGNGGGPFRNTCPPGSYVKSLTAGSAGSYVDNIRGECSDGTMLKMVGNDLKGAGTSYTAYGPFNNINVKSGIYVDNIFDRVGGNGGGSHTIRCPDNASLVGIYGRNGSLIDQIGGVCGFPADLPSYGGPGGAPFRQKCPDGTYLKKLYGVNNSAYVAAVGGQCSDGTKLTMMGDGNHSSAEDQDFSYTGPFETTHIRTDNKYVTKINNSGGSGGNPYEMRCPTGRKVIGYYGRSGSLIDQFGVMCGSIVEPDVPQISPPYTLINIPQVLSQGPQVSPVPYTPPVSPVTPVPYTPPVSSYNPPQVLPPVSSYNPPQVLQPVSSYNPPQVLPPVSSYNPPQVLPPVQTTYTQIQLSPSALTPIMPPTPTVITVPPPPLANLDAAIPYNPNNLVSNTSNVGLSGGASVNSSSSTNTAYNANISAGTNGTTGTTITPGSTLNLGVSGGVQSNSNTTTNSSVAGTVTNSVTTNNPPTVTVTTDTTKSDNTILYILFGLLVFIIVGVAISSFMWKSNQSNQANSNKRR